MFNFKEFVMNCPACKDSILTMSERSGIEIDYCPNCRGVWLDRGELDKIIEKSLEAKSSPIISTPRTRIAEVIYRDENSYKKVEHPHKRKKSFLEELFD